MLRVLNKNKLKKHFFAIIMLEKIIRKHMVAKNKSKKTDAASVHVKNTKTGRRSDDETISLRWYHILSTVVVISLAITAVMKILSHFDISLYGSKYTIKYAYLACTTNIAGEKQGSDADFRYAGIKNGSFIGENGITSDKDEAYIEIVSLDDDLVSIKTRSYGSEEWRSEKIRYGEEKTLTLSVVPDCMPGIVFIISK